MAADWLDVLKTTLAIGSWGIKVCDISYGTRYPWFTSVEIPLGETGSEMRYSAPVCTRPETC